MSTMERSRARAVADLADGLILATIEIAAPPERVFRALSSKEIVTWWGAEGVYRTTDWTGDVRVGGRWRASGSGADGKPFFVEGEYLEVDPPRRLVHTWSPEWDPGSATKVAYQLEAVEGGTRLTLRHSGFSSSESCAMHTDGWAMVLDWLRAHVAPVPSAPRTPFLIRLIPPRPTFAQDMSEDERRVMGEHVVYWLGLLGEGVAVAFGPVADPAGSWGLGVVEVDGPDRLRTLEANDPVISSGRGFRYEVVPMRQLIARP